jgi:hypothetical protein
MFESLEKRRLLAASVQIDAGGKLTVQGGSKGFNNIIVQEAPSFDPVNGHVYYHMEYSDPVNGLVVFDGEKVGVTSVVINGRNLGSNISFSGTTLNSQIQGGSGVDYISVTDAGTGSSKITAGKGDDNIVIAKANNTFVDAGDGNDQIAINSAAKGVYDPSTDSYVPQDNGVTIALAAESVTVKAGGGNDVIILFDGKVSLDGGGGSDTLLDESLGYGTVVSSTNTESTVVTNPGQ